MGVPMSSPADTTANSRDIPAPRSARVLFAIVLPLLLALQAVALVLAGAVIPFFEFTPIVIVFVAVISRHWSGASHRLLGFSAALAGLMAMEWLAWVVWFAATVPEEPLFLRVLGGFWTLYAVELVVLMAIFTAAVILSWIGLRRSNLEGRQVPTPAS